MRNEMAHYATDCWDAECNTTYGWVECVGCADRSCFDLSCHQKTTGIKLTAEKKLPEPVEKEFVTAQPKKGVIGKVFRQEAKLITESLAALSSDQIRTMKATLEETGSYPLQAGDKEWELKSDMVD